MILTHNDFTLSCVLFDLDGTLLNTAPDLVMALNKTLTYFHYPNVTESMIKPYISYGTSSMLKHAITQDISSKKHTELLNWLLHYYENNLATYTHLYEGITKILALLKIHNIPWGVITNKRERFALPLMKALHLNEQAGCIICGDTTAHNKPHSEPMLTACKTLHVKAQECLYIGDAQHDITAGNSVNMFTIVAEYGYLTPIDRPETWGANARITHPNTLFKWIKNALN